MATKRSIEAVARRLMMKHADVQELSDKLFRAKRRVYRRTLLEEATKLGLDVTRPSLSEEVESALRAEANDHAERIAATYNADLSDAAVKLGAGRTEAELREKLTTWARSRQRKRATPTAVTEAYSAHADAMMSVFVDLGLPDSTLFDFGGHPELGDAPPACDICVELMRGNPWPMHKVIEIGVPHPQCRQEWHVNALDQRSLPNDFELGQTVAGIVGSEHLIARHGTREAAAQYIVGLRDE